MVKGKSGSGAVNFLKKKSHTIEIVRLKYSHEKISIKAIPAFSLPHL